ncbi:MAG TPA: hypothetical protein DCQ51_03390 [Planktothrix sp. UBA8407]|jgi:hypothetical protein|nr:hypothetical protein [Planktothrix sp. UBA8402]HAO10233.1 hypothetical protein [Planktothrix sp. UBA8407]
MKIKALLAIILSVAGLQSCSKTEPQENIKQPQIEVNQTTKTASPIPPQPIDPLAKYDQKQANNLTDTAKLIAGIKVDQKSQFYPLTQSNFWVNYRSFIDPAWSKLEKQQLAKVSQWSEQELATINQSNPEIFYPFSGPDFLYASLFFPTAKEYVLTALEPVGTLPDFNELSESQRHQKLANIKNSLYSLLQFSFFQTKEMKSDLSNQGVLPLILLFMARTNNRILDLQYIGLDQDAKIQKFEKGMIPGVKIDFVHNGEKQPRTLYYFSADISDDGLKKTPQFSKFIKQINQPVTYLKAASYLMHRPGFSAIRELILDQSQAVLQDDSGIPLKYFAPKKWNLNFFGTYTAPISLFSVRYQPDLRKVYQSNTSLKPLNFGVGYKFGVNQSNLMLATKKEKP